MLPISKTMTEEQTRALMDYALACAADVSHGEGHIRRVLKNALALAEHYQQADRDVLCAAAILHDCAQAEQLADASMHHAEEGAKKARAFLLEQGADAAFAARVGEIIGAHSSPVLAGEAGLEALLLFDADKLEMCGAVGLSRALMYALDNKEELYAPEGSESFYSVARADAAFVREHLFTPEARALAGEKLKLSSAFLESLAQEEKL